MNNSKHLKRVLFNTISTLSLEHREFLNNPLVDFTRDRKLPFDTTIKVLLCMEAGSLKDELYKFFGLNSDNPTSSAFVQQRAKIKIDAFKWLFDEFNRLTYKKKNHLYKGYRLLAIDGSSTVIRTDTSDKETYLSRPSKNGHNYGYNAYHINASYDLLEHTYDDVVIKGEADLNEHVPMCTMVDRYKGNKAIFILDRGYESYNDMAHIVESGNKYLIRIKDIHSNGMAASLNTAEEEEFDIDIFRILTRKQTLITKKCKNLYKFLPSTSTFDYMDKENPFYEFNARLLRFKISDNTYECIITNLDRNDFNIKEIKDLYHKRWGIETSYRELKYSVGMLAFHSKKNESILQEIYIRMIFYNFSERIMRNVKPKREKRRHIYQLNFTRAFHLIRDYLKQKGGKNPPKLESILANELEPVRPNRSDPRKVKPTNPIPFIYRFD